MTRESCASERESRLRAERALEVACRSGRHDAITIAERDTANALLEKQLSEEKAARLRAERERDEARAINAAWERAALGAFGEGTTPANLLEGGQGMEQAVHDSDAGLAAAQKRIEGLEKWLSERATYFDDDAKELRAEASKLRKRGEEADSMFRLGCADYATGFARELRAALSSPAVTTGGLGKEKADGGDIPERVELQTELDAIDDVVTGSRPPEDFEPARGTLGRVIQALRTAGAKP